MKKSIIKKSISVNGKNGINTADIIITMNDGVFLSKGTHAVTHDDFSKNIPTHKIEVLINNAPWITTIDILSEEMVLAKTQEIMEKTRKHLDFLANSEPSPSFMDKLNAILDKP